MSRRLGAVWFGLLAMLVGMLAAPMAEAAGPLVREVPSIGAGTGAVLRSDGTVWATGNGNLGQLGHGAFASSLTPVQAESAPGVPLDKVVEITSGYGHRCALRIDATVWCWGDARNGRLGNGDDVNHQNRAVRVELSAGVPLDRVIAIRTGANYSVALRADGTVWSWGAGAGGLHCNGGTADVSRPVQATYLSNSAAVTDMVALGGGDTHNLMLRKDGTAWACGTNSDGQLGDGTVTARSRAVQVQSGSGGALTDVVELGGIGVHSIALRADGSVMTWGDNAYGQLSDGSTTDRLAAVPAVTLSGAAVNARSIAAGQYNNYWLQADGTVYASGYGGWYANGDGTTNSRTRAVQVVDTSGSVMTGVARVDGYQGGLAMKADGTVWGWGYNGDGRYGTGTTETYVQRATLSQLGRSNGWTGFAPGGSHTVALRGDGTVWAWGGNGAGQLGIGAVGLGVDGPPVQVTASGGAALANVIQVASGTSHSLALLADGSVWAWGAGDQGQLGDGTNSASAARAVQATMSGGALLTGATAIAAGGASSYARLANGSVVAWGANDAGQLGDGTVTSRNRAAPLQVTGGTQLSLVASLDAGRLAGTDAFAVFVRANGTAWSVGGNGSGQLGDGTTTSRSKAVQVLASGGAPLGGVVEASAGGRFALARLGGTGGVFAWGANDVGQLGSGSTSTSPALAPVSVTLESGAALSGIQQVDAAEASALSRGTTGTLRAWGSSTLGQVGDGTSVTVRPAAVSMVDAVGSSMSGTLLAAGSDHVGAIAPRQGGGIGLDVVSTGQDAEGQLGDCGRGSTRRYLVPLATTCPGIVNDGTGNDIDGQVSVTTLEASWTGHVDQTLLRYEYCMATATSAAGCSGTILVGWTNNGTSTTVTHTGLTLSVNSMYYTCVQLVRADGTTLAARCSDGVRVDDTAPVVPTLIAPADGANVVSTELTASYSDTYTSGVIEVQVCSDVACTSVAATATSAVVASGTNGTATPTIGRGTWYWRARAIDAAGLTSGWSGTWMFAYNAIPTATAVSPDSGTWVATRQPSLVVRHDDPDGDPGTITAELCSTSATDPWSTNCTSGFQASATGQLAVAAGTSATLAPNKPLADGTWYWRARTVDAANAASAWTGVRAINVDVTAPAPLPVVTLTRKGAGRIDVSWTSSTDGGVGGVSYEVQRYATGTSSWSTVCTTTSLSCTQTGLGGSEILVVRVRACDSLGNCSDWSGASAVANSGYLLRNTASANLNNAQSRVAVLPPGGTLDFTTTGVRLPTGNSAGRVGVFPFRYNNVVAGAIALDTTAPIDPQDTVNGWGWVIDDVDAKAVSAGGMEAVVTTEATAGTGGGVGRVLCRIWRAQTNGTTSLVSWQHLADAYGDNSDVMTASTAGPVTSTCDLSSALSAQLTFATDEVLYVELLLDATVAGASGDQYMLRFNDASTALNMPIPGTPPAVPTLVSPIAGARTSTTPTLVAGYSHPTATNGVLEVQFSTDATFASGVTTVTSTPLASGSTGSISPGTLAAGQTWHWRARARDTAGLASLWSAGESFRTTTPPSAPVPSSPLDGASLEAGSITLSAGAFADVDLPSDSHTASQWQVAPAGGDWSSPTADSGTTTTDLTSWVTPVLATGTWAWRVRYRDQYGAWSEWSSVANPRTVVLTAASASIALSTSSLALGPAAPDTDLTGSVTAAVSTTNTTGYTLTVIDESDTAALSCTCGDSIPDWTGTDATPTAWSAGLSGHGGMTVRDAPGGRMAKWGTGTGTTESDHVANHYAGLRGTSSTRLHQTSAASTTADVITTFRLNAATGTLAGTYSATLQYSIVANP